MKYVISLVVVAVVVLIGIGDLVRRLFTVVWGS